MNPTPVRQKLLTFLSPNIGDVLIAQTEDTSIRAIPEYGTPHPDAQAYPDHKFCLAVKADDQGKLFTFYYAAEWESQDLYNFEYISGSPDFKFDMIQRTYVIERANFEETVPAYGSAMPLIPENKWRTGYVLFQKKQVRSEIKELDSLFVFEQRIYVKRVTLSKVELDLQTGRSKRSLTTIYHRGEELTTGLLVEDAAADPNNAYWGLQSNGLFRELNQLSENFYAVTESFQIADGTIDPPEGEDPGSLNPPSVEVVERPVPKVDDYIVHFRAAFLEIPYGTAHPERTGFFLTYIKPADETGLLYEYYFVKSFEDQDDYNFTISQGDVLTRAYIIPRAEYLAGTALPALVVGDVIPAADTPAVLARYGFTHEYQDRADKPLDSYFVTVIRVFQKIVQSQVTFDNEFEREVRETVTFIAKGSSTFQNSPGFEVSVDDTHSQYDRVTTRELLPNDGDPTEDDRLAFPIQLPSVPGRANFPVPSLLTRVTIEQAWIYAYSVIGESPPAFDQDYYFDFKTIDPPQGPYDSRTLRFLTSDPQIVEDAYPAVRISPARETIGIASGWAYSHNDQNQAKVNARQINVPETIHGTIEINEPDGPTVGLVTTLLAPTPGFNEFIASSVVTADVNTSKTRFNLYVVDVVQVSIGGVYNNANYGFGAGSTGGIDAATDTTGAPVVSSAVFSEDNVTLDGTATPASSIRVFTGSGTTAVELGRATADPDGNFSVVMSTVFTDTTTVNVTARKSGKTSIILTATSNDLAPAAPTAFLASDGIALTGVTEPGALVTIAPDPVQQEITLTLTGTATADGSAIMELFTAFIPASPIFVPVAFLNTETASQVAIKARVALLENSAISAMFDVDVSGPDVILTKKSSAPNDASAYLNIEGADGIGTEASTITVAGRGTVTVTADESGNFAYSFSPSLPDGVTIAITAADAGGTSPATVIEASAIIPTTPTATLDDPSTISGTGTIGSVIVAVYQGEEVGTDTVDGSGDYEITLTRLFIAGEEITVYAHNSGSPSIRSASVYVTADNLNIPKPVISTVEDLYYGTMPVELLAEVGSLSDITVVVKELQGAMAEEVVTIAANYEWSFSIMTLFGLTATPENGERFEVVYRLSLAAGDADGPAATIGFARVAIPSSGVAWTNPPRTGLSASFVNYQDWTGSYWSGGSWLTDFPEFLTVSSGGVTTPQIGTAGLTTTGSAQVGYPGGKRVNYMRPDGSKNLAWVKVSYMGDGTVVRVRYPGSAKATQEFTLTSASGYAYKQRVNIPIITWTFPGNGDHTDTDMTLANLKTLIPPVIEITVESPDGRTGQTTHQRVSYTPFK